LTLVNKNVNRRRFLQGAAAVTGAALVAPWAEGLGVLGTNGRAEAAKGDYGPLIPTPDLRDGVNRIALPAGFQYRSFGYAGEMMSDGNLTPLAHDGMASFNIGGKIRLVRNHEDRNGPNAGSTKGSAATMYDTRAGAGCTTLVVNPFTRELERDFISQNGSIVNCAGGPTPWNSWITCEETNAGTPSGWLKQHGYSFDVPAAANSTVTAVAITDMGRFSHEAVAVDPDTWIVYETEDNGESSGLYRFIANTPGQLTNGGKLQMLAVDGLPQYNTITGQTVGAKLPVSWVDIADPNPAGTSSTAVFNQGLAGGGARFARLEGIWYGNKSLYFNSTSGGDAGEGQVWEYRPDSSGGGFLRLVFESPSADVLNAPDNIAVSPKGALILCEDGDDDQYLRVVTKDGGIFDFALNLQTEHEWAGATFAVADPSWNASSIRGDNAPLGGLSDRTTLFVNRQGATGGANPPSAGDAGITFAIWGPWEKGAL
jgi:uncharacterized protein